MRTGVAIAVGGLLGGFLVAASIGGPASASPASAPRPAGGVAAPIAADVAAETVRIRAVPATAGSGRVDRGAVAALAPVRTGPFALLGVTWAPGTAPADLRVSVRLHSAAGWRSWQQLAYEVDEGPTPAEDSDALAGTAPLWAGRADGLAVRLRSSSGHAPAGVEVVTVDPGSGTGDWSPARLRPSSGDAIARSPHFPRRPRVITRREWGADRSLTSSCFSPRYGSMAKMVFVHHTAGSNSYSARESPAVVRSILAYHTQGQNWCDIGYNALVDRFGNIYVGRRGGLRKPVRGAHAGDFNVNTVGVSLMGNYERTEPSRRTLNALVRFVGWRLGTSFAPVRGRVGVEGERFARISGHRDAMSTACPGAQVYDRLPHIRKRVAHYLGDYRPAAARKADALGRDRTGPVFVGEKLLPAGRFTRFAHGRIYVREGGRPHWVAGRALKRYRAEGTVSGALGWPRSDAHRIGVGRARMISFKHGRIYLPRRNKPRELHGRVLDRYGRLGYAGGRLGLPTSSIDRIRGGRMASFRGGVIRWDRSSNSFTVNFS